MKKEHPFVVKLRCSKPLIIQTIAISFNNTDLVEALKISAFDGHSSTYAVLPDGRVVVDNGSENMEKIYNFFATLEKSGNLGFACL